MAIRRIIPTPFKLSQQLHLASAAADDEPLWPGGAPTPAVLQTASAELQTLITEIVAAENVLDGLRAEMGTAVQNGQDLMRRVDHITSFLYGDTGPKKALYGLRPIDRKRSTPEQPKAPTRVMLTDGPKPASLLLDWKRVPGAAYVAEAWDGVPDAVDSKLLRSQPETASKTVFGDLPPGLRVFCRIRIIAGKRSGPWSDPVARFVNE